VSNLLETTTGDIMKDANAGFDSLTGEIFEAIRNDSEIGRGTCSTVDECESDEELRQRIFNDLTEGTYVDVKSALKWEKMIEGIRREREDSEDW
jgi:hypothetical protein